MHIIGFGRFSIYSFVYFAFFSSASFVIFVRLVHMVPAIVLVFTFDFHRQTMVACIQPKINKNKKKQLNSGEKESISGCNG